VNPSRETILIDTGPVIALIDSNDPYHKACDEVAETLAGPILTCLPVVTEACYMLNRVSSQLTRQIHLAFSAGIYQLLSIDKSDLDAVFGIIDRYNDQNIDFADACLMHLAERESIERVFTIDRKDFSVYRTQTGNSLTILPPLG